MTEETTNSSVNTETTEKQATDTFVPAWKIKADKVKEELGDNEQVFYESDQYFDCLPIARPKDAPNVFPFTSEEPTGFIAPKWIGATATGLKPRQFSKERTSKF